MRLTVIALGFLGLALSVQSTAVAAPDASGDALDAGLLDDTRLGGPVLTSPPPSEPVTTVRVVPPQAAPARPLSANPLWGIPLTQLSNTRERPVFSPSRRPPPMAVAEPVVHRQPPPPRKKEVEPPQLSLVGTIAGDDEGFGIFLDQSNNAALRLKVGEDFQGWRLSAIRGREVTMEKDEQGAVLTLPPPGGEGSGEVHLVPVSTIRTPLVMRR
jgi:general secretion pathway protein N